MMKKTFSFENIDLAQSHVRFFDSVIAASLPNLRVGRANAQCDESSVINGICCSHFERVKTAE